MNNTTPKEEEDEEQGEVPSQQQEKEETNKNNNIKEEAQPPMKPAALPLDPFLQISPGEGNPNAGHEQGVDQPKIISNNNNASNNNNRNNFEEDQAMAGTVYHLYLHQTPDNMRQKMTFPELCRKYSAIAWCGKLNVIACASETCARHPSSNVQPPFWIPIHIVNPERPTEHTVFNVTADSPRDFVQFIEWSPIACPRALLIGNFNGRVNIWSQPTQGPPNLARAVNCWYCEHEWRQDLAVVTKWLSGMSPFRWMNASSNASANSKLTFEEKYLSQQTQTSARWPNFLCVCSVFSSGSVQLRWSQWPASQSGTSPKWFATNKGLLGAGPSGIMTADAIITEAGTMLVAGVPIVNPSTVVVWEVTPGFGNNPQSTLMTSTGIGVPPSLNPPSWAGFSPLAAYLFSWQEYLCTEGKNTQSQLDTETIEGIVLNCSPVSNFSAYVSPEAAAQSAATTTWASGVSALAFDPSRGGSVLAVAIVEGQYMSPHNPDEGPSLTGWRVQRWESSHQQVALHPLFENSNSNSGGQSPMTTIWTTAVNRSIPPMKDFKSSLAGTTGNVAGSQVSVDFNSANIDKFNSDAVHQQSDVRMLAKIVFSGHGGEVAFAFRFGDVHLFSGSNFSPIDYYCASVGNTVALPAFSSTSCCLASVWHDNNKDCSVLKIVRILPPAVPSTPGKGNSSGWERAIAERIWWSLLVGVDWWDAVGCTQSAAEDDLVAINRVIAVLDADFHLLPTIQHRQQYGPALDRIKCRLLEGTVAQDVRALVLDMQARLLLDMLGKGIESALINPATLIPDPWQASSETLSTLGMDAMTVDPALVPGIQAYVDAVLDLASHFLTRLRRYASFCRTLASHAVGVSASSGGNRNMGASPTTGGASPSPGQGAPGGTASNPGNTQMQAWVQGAIAKISSNAEGSPSTTPSSVNGPAPLLPLSVNTATFPGTPAVRLIGDCHFLHRLCQLLLFCLIFRRRQLPRFMSGLQRNPDVQSVKPQPGFGGKSHEEINQGASRPSSAMVVVKSEDGQGVRPGQLIPGFKGGLDEVSNTRPARLGHGNAGQGYTADEVKVLFLVLVDLCKRTAPSAHPLPKSQVGAANVNIRLHYIDGQYTVAPEVVEASLGPHMQNLPRPRGADAAGLLLRELELHPPAEDWHKRNMFGGPWSDLGDLDVSSDEQNISTTLGAVTGISDFSTGMFSDDYQSVKGLWPRKRRFSERDAAFGLKTAVGMGAYLGLMGSRRDVITASWKTGLHGAWHKCLRCGRQTSALALPNSSTSANQNNNLEPWWIGRWACGCPMCGGPWVHVV